jgi:hypothetical protein
MPAGKTVRMMVLAGHCDGAGWSASSRSACLCSSHLAVLYSLVQSCKLIDVAPFVYLKDVLLRLATYPHRFIPQLTPRGWAETFSRTATQ